MQTTDQSLLNDFELNLVQASTGKRFANYIIDIIVFYVIVMIMAVIAELMNPGMVSGMDDSAASGDLGFRLLAILVFILYTAGMEAIFKGKTVGKFITRTKAVNDDGSR